MEQNKNFSLFYEKKMKEYLKENKKLIKRYFS